METLCSILFGAIGSSIFIGIKEAIEKRNGWKEPKLYSPDWLDINQHPINEDIGELIVTNGKNVTTCFYPSYDCNGKAVYSKFPITTYVTHWRQLPAPPKK